MMCENVVKDQKLLTLTHISIFFLTLFAVYMIAGIPFFPEEGKEVMAMEKRPVVRYTPDTPIRTLESHLGETPVMSDVITGKHVEREIKEYHLANGDRFVQQHITCLTDLSEYHPIAAMLPFEGEGILRYYDDDREQWTELSMEEGVYPVETYFLDSDGQHMILVPPQAYEQRENQMLESFPRRNGSMELRRTEDGWLVLFLLTDAPQGTCYESMYLTSDEPLIDWGEAEERWNKYDFTGDHRWTMDGYYYTTPSTYIPTGANYYHRLVSAYLTVDLSEETGRGADDLALVMLDTMCELQNDLGFFPTHGCSQWLQDDYQIGAGFYDTRFNSDLVQALIREYKESGVTRFRDAALTYGEFYRAMAEEQHYTVEGQGWLVWDYWDPEGNLPNHCSLNHQLAEILVLLELYDLSGDTEYEALAHTMLKGILSLGYDWIRYDNNLHYAYLADGSMGMEDYPYLTYNDLFLMREALDDRYGTHDPMLDTLMEFKRYWMNYHGVRDYMTE